MQSMGQTALRGFYDTELLLTAQHGAALISKWRCVKEYGAVLKIVRFFLYFRTKTQSLYVAAALRSAQTESVSSRGGFLK